MAKLYVVGIGPGSKENMTLKALEAIKKSKVIVGYDSYIELIRDMLEGKQVISTGMHGEIERCKLAVEKVKQGFDTSIISTGDAGLYGMAGPILELSKDIDVEVIPGVTSCFAAAAELGAPIMHDFCTISLSDILTPWETIEKRLECAGTADFVIAIYNPKSKRRQSILKRAVDIILKYRSPDTPVGIVKNAGRQGNEKVITTLSNIDYDLVDMSTVLIIGNSSTYVEPAGETPPIQGLGAGVAGGVSANKAKMVTPRGYEI